MELIENDETMGAGAAHAISTSGQSSTLPSRWILAANGYAEGENELDALWESVVRHGRSGNEIFQDRWQKVLVTGHDGFKGTWLTKVLDALGCEVVVLSDFQSESRVVFTSKPTVEQEYCVDIADTERCNIIFQTVKPDIVIHMAAQPLVRRSYREPERTWRSTKWNFER